MQSSAPFCLVCVDLPSIVQLAPLFLGLASTLLICHFAQPIGVALGLMDDPSKKHHSRHSNSVPLVGGLAVLLPVVLGGLIAGAAAQLVHQPTYWDTSAVFAAAVGVMMVIGLLDDLYHLTVRSRLVATTMLFVAVVSITPEFCIESLVLPFVGVAFPITFGWLAAPFTVLCLVALANAINMADGRNGLVIGMALIWAIALLSASPTDFPHDTLMLIASLLAAFFYNMRSKLFLGDGGTYGLAACFGLTAIWCHNYNGGLLSESQIACLFLIPLLDMVRLIGARLRRGVSPCAAGHDHLHHYLDDWMGWNRGLFIYLALVGLPVAVAFSVRNLGGEALLLGSALYLIVLVTARQRLAVLHPEPRKSSPNPA